MNSYGTVDTDAGMALVQQQSSSQTPGANSAAGADNKHVKINQFISEVVACVALVIYAAVTINLAPMPTPFFERDPSISFAFVEDTVSVGMLAGLAVGVPITCVGIGHVVRAYTSKASRRALVLSLAWTLLSFAQAVILTLAITDTIKNAFARHRPSFLARCDYAGYRAAAVTQNFTAYYAATTAGQFGDLSRCIGPSVDIADGQRSFPSGHASMAFAGLMWLTLYLRLVADVSPHVHFSFEAILCTSPLVLAMWVAITRVRDRAHNVDDVMAGALLGAACAWAAWQHLLRHHRRYSIVFPPQQGAGDAAFGTASCESKGKGQQRGAEESGELNVPFTLTRANEAV